MTQVTRIHRSTQPAVMRKGKAMTHASLARVLRHGLFTLAVGVLLVAGPDRSTSLADAGNGDPRSVLTAAFMEWSDQWADGVVDDLVSSVLATAEKRQRGLTDEQLRDIARDLSSVPDVLVITNVTHPTKATLYKQRLLYAVDNFLAFGAGDSKRRERFVEQSTSLVNGWKGDLVSRYPRLAAAAEEGARSTIKRIDRLSKNVLATAGKRPAEGNVVQQAGDVWAVQLSELPSRLENSPLGPAHEIGIAFTRALARVRDASERPKSLPKPQKLVNAEKAFRANLNKIMDWEMEELDRRTREKQKQLNIEVFVVRPGTLAIETQIEGRVDAIEDISPQDGWHATP